MYSYFCHVYNIRQNNFRIFFRFRRDIRISRKLQSVIIPPSHSPLSPLNHWYRSVRIVIINDLAATICISDLAATICISDLATTSPVNQWSRSDNLLCISETYLVRIFFRKSSSRKNDVIKTVTVNIAVVNRLWRGL